MTSTLLTLALFLLPVGFLLSYWLLRKRLKRQQTAQITAIRLQQDEESRELDRQIALIERDAARAKEHKTNHKIPLPVVLPVVSAQPVLLSDDEARALDLAKARETDYSRYSKRRSYTPPAAAPSRNSSYQSRHSYQPTDSTTTDTVTLAAVAILADAFSTPDSTPDTSSSWSSSDDSSGSGFGGGGSSGEW